jgi:hypothetical protein
MAKISTSVAAKRLGVGKVVVRNMVKNGLLKDFATTKDGRNGHHARLDSAEVKQFKAAHVRNGMKWVKVEDVKPKAAPRKLRLTPAPAGWTVAPEAKSAATGNSLKGKLFQRLDAIERKLDKFIEVFGDE